MITCCVLLVITCSVLHVITCNDYLQCFTCDNLLCFACDNLQCFAFCASLQDQGGFMLQKSYNHLNHPDHFGVHPVFAILLMCFLLHHPKVCLSTLSILSECDRDVQMGFLILKAGFTACILLTKWQRQRERERERERESGKGRERAS